MSQPADKEMKIELADEIEHNEEWCCLLLLSPGQKAGLLGNIASDIAYGWRGKVWLALVHDGTCGNEEAESTLRGVASEFASIDEPVDKLINISLDSSGKQKQLSRFIDKAGVDLVLVRNVDGAASFVSNLNCDVGVIRGASEQLEVDMAERGLNRVLIPSAGGPNTITALQIMRPLTTQVDINALYIVRYSTGEEGVIRGQHTINDILQISDVEGSVNALVHQARNAVDGILREGRNDYDLVMIGAPEDALSQFLYGDFVGSIVRECQKPVLVMKRSRRRVLSRIERINWQIRRIMPNLNRASRDDTYERIKINSVPDVSFYVLITLSAAIAGAGLLLDSPAVVIGAMLVAPLMSPIVGVGMSMVLGEVDFLRQATSAVLRGALLAIGVGMVIGLARIGAEQLPAEVVARTAPSLLDMVVALFSGLAGAYALCYSQAAGALPGVSIAAALVPPLAVVGICLTTGNLLLASGALLLFGTNLITIAAASGLIFLMLGFRPRSDFKASQSFRQRAARIAIFLLVINVLVLGGATTYLTARSNQESAIKTAVELSVKNVTESGAELAEIAELTITPVDGGQNLEISAVINAFDFVTNRDVVDIQKSIDNTLSQLGYTYSDISLKLQIVEFKVLDSSNLPEDEQ